MEECYGHFNKDNTFLDTKVHNTTIQYSEKAHYHPFFLSALRENVDV